MHPLVVIELPFVCRFMLSSILISSMQLILQRNDSEVKALDKEGPMKKLHKVWKHSTGNQTSADRTYSSKMPKGLKSFSHELGPKGGIRPVHPRPRSFGDLKVLFFISSMNLV